ncbi:MAG: hypothetical protein JWL85_107 [Candidatus Saccharibacteria bacterium]|nr:hypothetical protein [Candidatus Saccharibacteria bacterium]
MQRLWLFTGRTAFWLSYPLLYWYLRLSRRTRVVMVSQGKVLVVKGWLSNDKWMLPGGGLHRGEDGRLGAAREVFEETGIRVPATALQSFGMVDYHGEGFRFQFEQFWIALDAPTEPKIQQREIVEIAWVPIEELTSGNTRQDALEVLAAWKRLV